MKAYSLDLRQKIIDVYNEGNISQRQLAKQFRVALSFIQKLLKQYRQTGNIAPKVRTQQTPTKLNPKQLKVLQELVNTNNDATKRGTSSSVSIRYRSCNWSFNGRQNVASP